MKSQWPAKTGCWLSLYVLFHRYPGIHYSSICVTVGQEEAKRGDRLRRYHDNSTGNHLCFEIWKNGEHIGVLSFVTRKKNKTELTETNPIGLYLFKAISNSSNRNNPATGSFIQLQLSTETPNMVADQFLIGSIVRFLPNIFIDLSKGKDLIYILQEI